MEILDHTIAPQPARLADKSFRQFVVAAVLYGIILLSGLVFVFFGAGIIAALNLVLILPFLLFATATGFSVAGAVNAIRSFFRKEIHQTRHLIGFVLNGGLLLALLFSWLMMAEMLFSGNLFI